MSGVGPQEERGGLATGSKASQQGRRGPSAARQREHGGGWKTSDGGRRHARVEVVSWVGPLEGGLGTGSTTTGAAGWQEGSDVCGRVNRHQGTNACAPAEC